ncbi:MAG: hypothetical protein AAF236_02685 [Verrucomicrobiota bacterium]
MATTGCISSENTGPESSETDTASPSIAEPESSEAFISYADSIEELRLYAKRSEPDFRFRGWEIWKTTDLYYGHDPGRPDSMNEFISATLDTSGEDLLLGTSVSFFAEGKLWKDLNSDTAIKLSPDGEFQTGGPARIILPLNER